MQLAAWMCLWEGLHLQISRAGLVLTPYCVLWGCSLVLAPGLSSLLEFCRKCPDEFVCRTCYIRVTCPQDPYWLTPYAIYGEHEVRNPVWMGEIQDLNYMHPVVSSWQPSSSVLEPERSMNKTPEFLKQEQRRDSEQRKAGWQSATVPTVWGNHTLLCPPASPVTFF